MSASEPPAGGVAPGPSILDLLRLSTRDMLPPGGEAVYRQVALLAGLDRERSQEVIDVACGTGAQLRFLVEEFGVQGSGVDADPGTVERAEARAQALGLGDHLQFQEAPLSRLPYRDEIFDVAVGELGLTADTDPETAIREMVRVTKPGGTIVLLQLVWKTPVAEERRASLSGHLGTRPRMLVEWKQRLREAGVGDLHVSDWSDEEGAFQPRLRKPFPDFAEMFSLREKLSILRRARKIWGWSGVRRALECEAEVHRLLTRERTLGFVMIKGMRPEATVEVEMEAAVEGEGVDLPLFRTPGSADPVGAEPEHPTAAKPSRPSKQVTRSIRPTEPSAPPPAPLPTEVAGDDRGVGVPPPVPKREPQIAEPAQVQGLPLFTEEKRSET